MKPETTKWAKGTVGAIAILLWGLFFDQLARAGRWIFDTTYASYADRPLSDLQGRYLDAHLVLTHGSLYAIRTNTFTYPPFTAYIFVPFRAIGLSATLTVWTVSNMVALACIAAIALHRWFKVAPVNAWFVAAAGLAPAAVFAFYPYRSLLIWGQLGIFLMLLVFLDLFVVPDRYKGLLIGLATAIKLMPVLFIVWFIAKREIASAIRVVVSFFVLTLFAAALWPHASAYYWFHVFLTGRFGRTVTVAPAKWIGGVGKLSNQSLRGLLGRPPFISQSLGPWLALAIIVLVAGVIIAIKYLRQGRDLVAFLLLSVLTELVSPVSWPHYWVFIGFAPLVAILEWKQDRPLAVASIILALATCVNLENHALAAHPFTTMAPVVLFVVRNIYVLGGLIFLATAGQRVFGPKLPIRSESATSPAASISQ